MLCLSTIKTPDLVVYQPTVTGDASGTSFWGVSYTIDGEIPGESQYYIYLLLLLLSKTFGVTRHRLL